MFRELLKTGILFSRKEKHENMFDYGLFSKQVLKNCWRLFNISRGISPNTRALPKSLNPQYISTTAFQYTNPNQNLSPKYDH